MILKLITALSALLAVAQAIFGVFWLLPVYFVGCFLGFLLLAVAVFLVSCALVDVDKPQEQDSPFFRWMAKYFIELVVTLLRIHVHTQGLEKLPKQGRFVMVCNHINDLDPGVLLYCCPDSQLAFISKKENKHMPVIGAAMHKLQCQMIDRENDREALKTILKCIQIIKDDKASIGVFPEGYVSLDGKLRHFRSGVLKIAHKSGVPIVVCTIKGTKQIFSNIKKLRPSEVEMHLVDVISAEDVKALSTVDLGEQIYEMMIADMGEAYRSDEKAMHPDLQRKMMGQ